MMMTSLWRLTLTLASLTLTTPRSFRILLGIRGRVMEEERVRPLLVPLALLLVLLMSWAEALKLPLRSLLKELRLDWLLDKEDLQHGRRRDVCVVTTSKTSIK